MFTWALGIVATALAAVLAALLINALVSPTPAAGPSVAAAPTGAAPSAEVGVTPPISWTVTVGEANRKACNIGVRWVLPKPSDKLPPVPDDGRSVLDQMIAYASAQGGVLASNSAINIVVQSTRPEAVVLTGMEAVVVARRSPVAGTETFLGGCGGLQPRSFAVDGLDAGQARVTPQNGSDEGVEIPAVTFPYTVSASEPEFFRVYPRVVDHDVDWYLELSWVAGGTSGKTMIDDRGKPFRTTGTSAAEPYYYDATTGRWRTP